MGIANTSFRLEVYLESANLSLLCQVKPMPPADRVSHIDGIIRLVVGTVAELDAASVKSATERELVSLVKSLNLAIKEQYSPIGDENEDAYVKAIGTACLALYESLPERFDILIGLRRALLDLMLASWSSEWTEVEDTEKKIVFILEATTADSRLDQHVAGWLRAHFFSGSMNSVQEFRGEILCRKLMKMDASKRPTAIMRAVLAHWFRNLDSPTAAALYKVGVCLTENPPAFDAAAASVIAHTDAVRALAYKATVVVDWLKGSDKLLAFDFRIKHLDPATGRIDLETDRFDGGYFTLATIFQEARVTLMPYKERTGDDNFTVMLTLVDSGEQLRADETEKIW